MARGSLNFNFGKTCCVRYGGGGSGVPTIFDEFHGTRFSTSKGLGVAGFLPVSSAVTGRWMMRLNRMTVDMSFASCTKRLLELETRLGGGYCLGALKITDGL